MKNKIILYHPKTSHEKNYLFYWIPYSVLSIAAPLVKEGFDVEIIDGNLGNNTPDFDDLLCVGVSSMIGHQIEDGTIFCKRVREESDVPIVWGGALPTTLPGVTLDSEYVDYIVRGQGEDLFLRVVKALRLSSNLPEGLGYIKNNQKLLGEVQKTVDRNGFPNYPYYLINVEDYVRNDPKISDRVINYVSSQGCVFGCGFCTDVAMYQQRWSAYSSLRTLEEVLGLAEMSSANGIKFYDSNFFINKKRAIRFAQGLVDNSYELKWAASAHPRNLLNLDDEEFRILKKSGLKRLLIGAESGVQEELDFIKKRVRVEEVKYLADKLGAQDINGSFTFVTGYPTMPEENIDITLNFASELAESSVNHEFKIHFYLPFPGTPLYKLALMNGFKPPKTLEGWSKLDYYQIETPWVNKKYKDMIRRFNKEYCPYVL